MSGPTEAAKQLRSDIAEVLLPRGYEPVGRWAFVRRFPGLERTVKIQGSRGTKAPYHVSWGVVVPNLVPPVWLVDYKPGEPETGLVYGNGVDLPGVRNSGFVNFDPEHRVVDREIEDAAVRRQALLADERMSDITSIETLIDEIEGGNRETRFFPFDGWIWVLVMSLEVLAGRASFEKVARMPEWANADARARKVLEAVAMR